MMDNECSKCTSNAVVRITSYEETFYLLSGDQVTEVMYSVSYCRWHNPHPPKTPWDNLTKEEQKVLESSYPLSSIYNQGFKEGERLAVVKDE